MLLIKEIPFPSLQKKEKGKQKIYPRMHLVVNSSGLGKQDLIHLRLFSLPQNLSNTVITKYIYIHTHTYIHIYIFSK